jgi:hydroxypyruvate isomerase
MINRREFLSIAAGSGLSLVGGEALGATIYPRSGFARLYAPHFTTFRHHAAGGLVDGVRFLADEGFAAVEECALRARPAIVQSRIGDELARRNIAMGLFTGLADFGRPTFASGRADLRRDVLRELELAVATARRTGGKFLSVVPGKVEAGLPMAIQMRHAADTLNDCADVCEAENLVLVLEPIDHGPGASRLFLRSAMQAAELCRSVARPSCRFLFDVYQQTVVGEDLPRLLAATSDVLGYVQLADFPGRKEPGTGVIDFQRLFAALDAIGYRGFLGMEHGNAHPGREGERAVIDAYQALGRLS